jgi:hypothetical protein
MSGSSRCCGSSLGFSDVVGHPTCPDYPGYQQRCFTTVAVDGRPAEQEYARSQGCVAMNSPCTTSPGGNQGSIWCCAPGWPHVPVPGETPPIPPAPPPPPGFQTWIRQWWFWGLVGGVGAAAFFGWKLWQSGHQVGGSQTEEEGWESYNEFVDREQV